MKVSDFIHDEEQFKGFSLYDNERNLPSIVDGLKPSQRKILWTALQKQKDWKVNSLASIASDFTHYQHGDLAETIIKMAQDYPNSNNYPLLQKMGQFGNRLDKNGASAPRYIKVSLSKHIKTFFNPIDHKLLPENVVDDEVVEPKFLMPVLPLVLLNRNQGVGTGFASSILPHSIRTIKQAIKEYVETGDIKMSIKPYLKDFTGTIETEENTTIFTGVYEIVNTTNIIIKDLPPTYNNESYKALLNKLVDKNIINDYENHSKESYWKFVINCPRVVTKKTRKQLIALFGLQKRITQNFTMWKENGYLHNFKRVEDVIMYWVDLRMKWVEKRKKYMIKQYRHNILWNDIQSRFIEYWNNNSNTLVKMSKPELTVTLKNDITSKGTEIEALLKKPISSLTKENRLKFIKQSEEYKVELGVLENKTIKQMYFEDLEV